MSWRSAGLTAEEKRELLARALTKKAQQTHVAPLSLHQERIWFLDQLDPGNPLYNICGAISISGVIDLQVVRRVLDEMSRRHETLRTTFRSDSGNPLQVIAPHVQIPLKTIDISSLPVSEHDREIDRISSDDARTPFDLAAGPLARTTLIRRGNSEHVALITIHHSIADGWSIGVFVRDLGLLYHAFSQQKSSPLPELPIQYRDYARWQRERLKNGDLDDELSYWKRHLAGAPLTIDLPTDRPRSIQPSFAGKTEPFRLPDELSQSIKTACTQHGVTLFMFLMAAFSALLYRRTRQSTMLIPTPIAGRERPETQDLIGFFVNNLILRIDLTGDPSFGELLRRVRQTALDAFAHQELPFHKLVQELNPERDPLRPPFGQTAFVLQNTPMPNLTFPGLRVSSREVHNDMAKIDLTVFMWEEENEIAGFIEYSTALFERATIKGMITEYRDLLDQLVDTPEMRLSEFAPASQRLAKNDLDHLDGLLGRSNLTENQLLIWIGQKLDPESPLYNVPFAITIHENLEVSSLRQALNVLVNSSDILRTVIREAGDIPRQHVLPELDPALEVIDFSSDPDPGGRARVWMQESAQRTFDLSSRLFEFALIKVGDKECVLFLNAHHLIADGQSLAIIYRTIALLYDLACEGNLPQRVRLSSFDDYLALERSHRQSPKYLASKAYWDHKLTAEMDPLSFYGRATVSVVGRIRRISVDLGAERTSRLQTAATSGDTTSSLLTIFLALMGTYLHRITGNRNVSIGTPFHNRRSKEFKETIGPFMQVLPLHLHPDPKDSFQSIIHQARVQVFEALRHADYPIGNPSHNKTYDVLVNHHTESFGPFNERPAQSEWIYPGSERDALALQIQDFGLSGSLKLDFDFHRDVFDKEQAERATAHFMCVLDEFLRDETQPIGRVNILPPDERQKILEDFNDTRRVPAEARTLHSLVEEQVERTPDQTALHFENQMLSYTDFNRRANQLADYLTNCGVHCGRRVGVCMEQSLDLPVAILGILKAGGAFVPMDPDYPKERLEFIVRDAGVQTVLTQQRLKDRLPDCDARIIYLDSGWDAIAEGIQSNPHCEVFAEDLAYVMYTSGSTGPPKGVMISHAAISNRVTWGAVRYGLDGNDCVLQKASFAYDAAVWELFEPLVAGAQVVMARQGGRQDSAYLVKLIADRNVTVFECVPSLLQVMLDEKDFPRCNRLRRVFSGGETLSADLVNRFHAASTALLINTYGPTETSVDVSHWVSNPDIRTHPYYVGTSAAGIAGRTFPMLFESQVARSPDSPAVEFEGQSFSYDELNRRANKLAAFLIKCGVGPDMPVGIYMEPSHDVPIAIIAILKSGGAFVPIDPEYPKERWEFVMRDSGMAVLLSQERFRARLPANSARIVYLDTEWSSIAREQEANPEQQLSPQNLAYLIYTSGSTGTPKGAMITHGGMCNRLQWDVDAYNLGRGDRELQKTSLAFDASIVELLGPLIAGGEVVIAPQQGRNDASFLVKLIAEKRITVLEVVPSLLSAMLEDPDIRNCAHLRRVISAGEALHPDVVDRFHRVLQATLINAYGPTEVSVGVTHWVSSPNSTTIPIGRPFTNTQLYVCDQYVQPVPIGVAGELYIGGVCIGRGYLNNPGLTAEMFIPNPFSSRGDRLYRSGDATRYLPDGNIEFLGRLDQQVKLRGYRVELGEIESILHRHPAVRDVAVVLREDAPGDQRLVAYVVRNRAVAGNDQEDGHSADAEPTDTNRQSIADLREFLMSRLPQHMVPSDFVLLEALPVTPNGKLDRKALLPPGRSMSDRLYTPPRTETERILAALWEEVLGIERVGAHDDFFALGGHSLLAMKLVSRVRQRFAAELPVRKVFENHTVAGIAKVIDEIQRHPTGASEPITRAAPGEPIPLSHSQQILWFLEQYEHGIAYNTPLGLRLKGSLRTDVLERSLNEIIRRHDVLRASIVLADGQPVHRIHPFTECTLAVRDCHSLPESDRENAALQLGRTLVREPFDLTRPPLIRFLLVQVADDEHILFISVHHVVFDGWSCFVFVKELVALYDAFVHDAAPPPGEATIQYTDYAHWLRKGMHGGEFDGHVAFWNKQLGGNLPVLDLQTDHPRPKSMNPRAAHEEFVIPKDLMKGLKTVSRQEGASLFMTLLAAYVVLLHRYSGQGDVIVGTHAANRTRPETHDLIGFVASFLPLRLDSSGNPTFVELLRRVREVCLASFSHLEVPVDRLQAVRATFDSSRMPVAQAYFSLEDFPGDLAFGLDNLRVSAVRFFDIGVSGFDVALFMREEGGELKGSLVYRTEIFEADTVRRMLGHFTNIVHAITTQPEQRIAYHPLLSETERRQLFTEWNSRLTDAPSRSVHQMFEAQVGRTPNAIAVISDDTNLTYEQLNAHANQIAHRLRALGVGPEEIVAVVMDRSHITLAAILGVLKAGGAYLPISPRQPGERIEFIVREARARAVLTLAQFGSLVQTHNANVVPLDEYQSIDSEPSSNLDVTTEPHNLAYVIYTSGSTGTPKGVMVEHQSVANVVSSFINDYNIHAGDRMLHQASIGFDVSVNEIFPILSVGGAVVISRAETFDPANLAELVARHHITIFGAAPSVLSGVNQMADRLDGVRLILSGGEKLAARDVDRLAEHIMITNGYGPTETTVCTSCFVLTPDAIPDTPTVPIGKPITNYTIHLLDQNLQPVPVGCVGEICIGGMGLARGYMNDPELTAAKFIPDPFIAGGRLFRSGDLAKRLPDGNIVFLGRGDRQIKLRGMRIEFNEIELHLRHHERIAEAAVTMHEDDGEARLVAYYVPTTDIEFGDTELRRFMQRTLPDYMVPSYFIRMSALPHTSSGKVDHRALPKPERLQPDLGQSVPPRTEDETALARIWSEVLKVGRIGVFDNFFSLGGHSLLAVQVMYRVKEQFQKDVPIRYLFESPTIADLAERIRTYDASSKLLTQPGAQSPLVPLHLRDGYPLLYCIHPIGGQVHFYKPLALLLENSVYGIQSRALHDPSQEHATLEIMVSDYAALIAAHGSTQPVNVLGFSTGGILAMATAAKLEQMKTDVGSVILLDTHWPDQEERRIDDDSLIILLQSLEETFREELQPFSGLWNSFMENSSSMYNQLLPMSQEERINHISQWLGQFNLPAREIAEVLTHQNALYHHHYTLVKQYSGAVINSPIIVCAATEGMPGTRRRTPVDWGKYTTEKVTIVEIPASHFDLLKPPIVEMVTGKLRIHLSGEIERI